MDKGLNRSQQAGLPGLRHVAVIEGGIKNLVGRSVVAGVKTSCCS